MAKECWHTFPKWLAAECNWIQTYITLNVYNFLYKDLKDESLLSSIKFYNFCFLKDKEKACKQTRLRRKKRKLKTSHSPITTLADDLDFKIINPTGSWNRMGSTHTGCIFMRFANTCKIYAMEKNYYKHTVSVLFCFFIINLLEIAG